MAAQKWPPTPYLNTLTVISLESNVLLRPLKCHFPLILVLQPGFCRSNTMVFIIFWFCLDFQVQNGGQKWLPTSYWKSLKVISLEPRYWTHGHRSGLNECVMLRNTNRYTNRLQLKTTIHWSASCTPTKLPVYWLRQHFRHENNI